MTYVLNSRLCCIGVPCTPDIWTLREPVPIVFLCEEPNCSTKSKQAQHIHFIGRSYVQSCTHERPLAVVWRNASANGDRDEWPVVRFAPRRPSLPRLTPADH